jgi:hypothetical protein
MPKSEGNPNPEVDYRLSAIGYRLSATGYRLLAIGYWLLAIGYWLLAIGYWLLAIGDWNLVILPTTPRMVVLSLWTAKIAQSHPTDKSMSYFLLPWRALPTAVIWSLALGNW